MLPHQGDPMCKAEKSQVKEANRVILTKAGPASVVSLSLQFSQNDTYSPHMREISSGGLPASYAVSQPRRKPDKELLTIDKADWHIHCSEVGSTR